MFAALAALLKKFSYLVWPAVWAVGLGWMVASAPTIGEFCLAIALAVALAAGGFLGSQWLAWAYRPADVTPARPFAKYGAAFSRAVAPAARTAFTLALLYIGVATQHLVVLVLGAVATLCACLGLSLFWDAPRMAAFEALAPQLLQEGIQLARGANRPLLVGTPALAALRSHPTEQRLERAVVARAAVAKTTYRDLWYSAEYAPLRANVLCVLWGPAEARLYLFDHFIAPALRGGKVLAWAAAGRVAPAAAGAALFSAEAYLDERNLTPLGKAYVALWPHLWAVIVASGLPSLYTPRVARVLARLARLARLAGRGVIYLWHRRPLLPDLGTHYLKPRPSWARPAPRGAYARVEAGLRALGATPTPACLNVFSEAEVFASAGGPLFPPLFLGWSFVSRAFLLLVGFSAIGCLIANGDQNKMGSRSPVSSFYCSLPSPVA